MTLFQMNAKEWCIAIAILFLVFAIAYPISVAIDVGIENQAKVIGTGMKRMCEDCNAHGGKCIATQFELKCIKALEVNE